VNSDHAGRHDGGYGRGFAHARAALAGNPSDGYGGAVLAVTLPAWRAEAEAAHAPHASAEPPNALVEATERRFARSLQTGDAAVSWRTAIPQRVGLGSSSALAIAVIRALCELHAVELEPAEMAEMALAVETEDLGIVAGLQDRVVQSYGGLVFMEFGADGRYEPLDAGLLPALVVAWREDAAANSSSVHEDLRERHREGDAEVRAGIEQLAGAARGAREALLTGDRERFGACVDRTFDARARMLELDPRCVEMVMAARSEGAAANYTGSGGAIVAVCRDSPHAAEVARAVERTGCATAQLQPPPE
jgi:glucuronokinase